MGRDLLVAVLRFYGDRALPYDGRIAELFCNHDVFGNPDGDPRIADEEALADVGGTRLRAWVTGERPCHWRRRHAASDGLLVVRE